MEIWIARSGHGLSSWIELFGKSIGRLVEQVGWPIWSE